MASFTQWLYPWERTLVPSDEEAGWALEPICHMLPSLVCQAVAYNTYYFILAHVRIFIDTLSMLFKGIEGVHI